MLLDCAVALQKPSDDDANVLNSTLSRNPCLFFEVPWLPVTDSAEFGVSMEATKPKPENAERPRFVLVHGGQHGAWCWFKTLQLLHQAGYSATALDLVSAGDSAVDADDVTSFDQYSQPLYAFLESLPAGHKVVLVGHSMGGTTVARATERYPEKIHVTVYLAAAMLTSGMAQGEVAEEMFRHTSKDAQFHFGNGEQNPPTSIWPSLEVVTQYYYNCCSAEDVEFASKRLKPIPIMGDDATTFTEKGYYSVPRVYIRTSLDEAVKPHFQDRYIAANPPTAVLHLESDHSPFFSAPEELHQLLLSIATTYAKGLGSCEKESEEPRS